jgi:hypothetical protein
MLTKLPLVALIVHSSLVAFVAVVVALSRNSEIAGIWVMFMVIDFPLSVLAIPIELIALPMIHDHSPEKAWSVLQYICLPALTFFIVGGAQYYLLARLVAQYRRAQILRRDVSADVPCGQITPPNRKCR